MAVPRGVGEGLTGAAGGHSPGVGASRSHAGTLQGSGGAPAPSKRWEAAPGGTRSHRRGLSPGERLQSPFSQASSC